VSAAAVTSGTTLADDQRFMALALTLGRRGLGQTWPNPAVGAVIVKDGVIIARGWTQAGGRPHAEVEALKRAGAAAQGATMYVTLEPCSHQGKSPPCANAIIKAGITRVVSALEDPNPDVAGQGHARLAEAGIAVDIGIGAEEARRAHAGHIRRVTDRRPHVTLKLAVSADGKVGAAGRLPVAITGERARDRVHLMRAQYDAILVGFGTALADDPSLTCRLSGMAARSPVRIVLDSQLRLPLACQLIATAHDTPTWMVGATDASKIAEDVLRAKGCEVLRVGAKSGKLNLKNLLKTIAKRGITRLMVEGGPTVAASFLQADLVDQAVLFRSPKMIGADGIDALEGLPLTRITRSSRLAARASELIGEDAMECYGRN
jgi:diaminohydroxyphosphoribosylaminopyrimidine deaminase / 5-amino-6-(5-phosphoribosylamino)uracil reductase